MGKDDARLVKVECKGMEFVVDEGILIEFVRRILGKRKVVFKDYDDMVRLMKKCYLYSVEFLENIVGYRIGSEYFR